MSKRSDGTDGSWSGNLFDFYRRVSRKLMEDLKVPFVLKNNVRQDDTPLHQALREAMVNALVHADYSGRASVLVVKQPSGFLFRNPGSYTYNMLNTFIFYQFGYRFV